MSSFPPARLGIFYGWPSAVNGSSSVDEAVSHFSSYSYLVLGWGIQERGHGDHARAAEIIAALAGSTTIFGYVPLGQAAGLSERRVKKACKAWRKIGVSGVLLDEAGYDFGNTRERQNRCYEAAHRYDLSVIANAWNPDDLLSTFPTRNNSKGARCALRAGDFVLYESYRVKDGSLEDAAAWREKIASLQPVIGSDIGVMGITTGRAYDQRMMDHAVWCAILDGLAAVGWGEPDFSAVDNVLPSRPWPRLPEASDIRYHGETTSAAGRFSRETSLGAVVVDSAGGGGLV